MRVFFAVPVNPLLEKQIKNWIAANDFAEVKWIEPRNWHLTLRFIGEVSDQQLAQIQQSMAEGLAHLTSSFELDVLTIERFPSTQGHLLVARLDKNLLIDCLRDEVNGLLKGLEIAKEKLRFRPHITLGHLPKQLNADWQPPSFGQGAWLEVHQVVLYHSDLTGRFPEYVSLAKLELHT